MKRVRAEFSLEAIGRRIADTLGMTLPAPTYDATGPQMDDLIVRETPLRLEPAEEFRPIFRDLLREGRRRVALYGAGQYCKDVLTHGRVDAIEFVCLFEDRLDRHWA